MLRGAALAHKAQFERYVASAGRDVEVRPPAAPTASVSASDKVLGKRTQATGAGAYGESIMVKSIVGAGYVLNADGYPAGMPPQISALGRAEQLDLILRTNVADVLVDAAAPLGRTLFHLAKDVKIDGQVFEIAAIDRSGLAPLDPYILWVGLKKSSGGV